MRHPLDKPHRAAVLVVDMQEGFVRAHSALRCEEAFRLAERLATFVEHMRAAGLLIIWTRQSADPHGPRAVSSWFEECVGEKIASSLRGLVPGAPDHEIDAGFDVGAADWIVDKYRASAFLPDRAHLHERIVARGIDTLIVTGTVTNFCCQSTARDAAMLDYRVIFPPDLVAAGSDDAQRTTLADLSAMGFFDLRMSAEILDEVATVRAAAQ